MDGTMQYGSTIGKKFYDDGSVIKYPGNTVVADVTPKCPAYEVMTRLYCMVKEHGLDGHIILLPTESYHMTVISGVNDQVRLDTHWPPNLPKDTPMDKVDDYIAGAIGKLTMPGRIRMKFDQIHFGSSAMLVLLLPADEEQERILREFRDRAAEKIGFRLPRHEKYRFHISLGYTRIIPEGEDVDRMNRMIAEMNQYIANRPVFEIDPPYMAFYNDMYYFSPTRLLRVAF